MQRPARSSGTPTAGGTDMVCRGVEYCDYCNLKFGSAEDRKRTDNFVYHITCYGKLIMRKFKAIGGIAIH